MDDAVLALSVGMDHQPRQASDHQKEKPRLQIAPFQDRSTRESKYFDCGTWPPLAVRNGISTCRQGQANIVYCRTRLVIIRLTWVNGRSAPLGVVCEA